MKMNRSTQTALFGLAVCVAAALVLAEPSFAQGTSSAETMLGTIITFLTGPVGKGLAVIALIATGISWMFGAIDMRQAGGVAIGIIVVASAKTFVDLIWGA
jgi:type IV secretion system protein VirB2